MAYKWHLLLGVVLALECLSAVVFHRSEDELRALLSEGTAQEQVEALFVLTNRDVPITIGKGKIQSLLESPNPLIAEWMMTTNFLRFGYHHLKENHIRSLPDSEAAFRCQFFQDHQIGRQPIKLSDLSRFLKSE
ncbi:MAG: hypothetical protein KJ645_11510 [Planctomycetes bacterium]|nr:hypothetical protein [Planctomycetota bacterium]